MILALLLGCGAPRWTESELAQIASLTPLPAPVSRPSNRYADDPAAAAVGARIFVDPGFSSNGAVSCATCHDPDQHFTDGRPVAVGIGTTQRNTPSVETVAWGTWFFWDGRADSAWAQAAGPLLHPDEMGLDGDGVRDRVAAGYAADWERFFGGVGEPERVIAEVGKLLEAFQRTLSPGEAPFDRWAAALAAGRPSEILSIDAQRGLRLFLAEDCVACHAGPLLTNQSFHNLGLPQGPDGDIDPGRAQGAIEVLADPRNCFGVYADRAEGCDELRFLDPNFEDWAGSFKTPSLRNVAATAPYTHDGAVPDLLAMMAFYDTLAEQPPVGHREEMLRPLRLRPGEREELVAFLESLTAG